MTACLLGKETAKNKARHGAKDLRRLYDQFCLAARGGFEVLTLRVLHSTHLESLA